MATLSIALKHGAGTLEITASQRAAVRVFNRYVIFLQQGSQPSSRFLLDDPPGGMLALDFENVAAMHVAPDPAGEPDVVEEDDEAEAPLPTVPPLRSLSD